MNINFKKISLIAVIVLGGMSEKGMASFQLNDASEESSGAKLVLRFEAQEKFLNKVNDFANMANKRCGSHVDLFESELSQVKRKSGSWSLKQLRKADRVIIKSLVDAFMSSYRALYGDRPYSDWDQAASLLFKDFLTLEDAFRTLRALKKI